MRVCKVCGDTESDSHPGYGERDLDNEGWVEFCRCDSGSVHEWSTETCNNCGKGIVEPGMCMMCQQAYDKGLEDGRKQGWHSAMVEIGNYRD